MPRSRLTRRGRLTLVVGLVLLLLAAFSLGRAATTQAATTAPPSPVHAVTVQPGETLWGVATRLAPGRDPRVVVEQIRRLNGLTGASLRAGQQLRLPAAA